MMTRPIGWLQHQCKKASEAFAKLPKWQQDAIREEAKEVHQQ